MMAAKLIDTVTTGEDLAKTYERTWIIKNFHVVCNERSILDDQLFELKTNHFPDTICNWNVFLRLSGPEASPSIYVAIMLTDFKGAGKPEVSAIFETKSKLGAGQAYKNHNVTYEKFKPNGFIVIKHFLVQTEDVNYRTILQSDGSTIISIKLTVLRPSDVDRSTSVKSEEEKIADFVSDSQRILVEKWRELASSGEFSDVKIISSDGMELHGHKLVLQVQNPVFAAMLASNLSESETGIVKVDDVSGKTLKIILNYIYTGELLPAWKDADTIVEFTYAAGKYQLTEVLKMLDNSLGKDGSSNDYDSCYVSLMSLANKLSLEKAEKNLLRKVVQVTAECDSAEEFLGLINENADCCKTTKF